MPLAYPFVPATVMTNSASRPYSPGWSFVMYEPLTPATPALAAPARAHNPRVIRVRRDVAAADPEPALRSPLPDGSLASRRRTTATPRFFQGPSPGAARLDDDPPSAART